MPGYGNIYHPSLELLTQRSAGVGKVFFVDSGGDNGNEGTDPNHPLDAVTDALGKCTSGKGDAIIILGLSPSTAEATETFPIAVTKSTVLIAGLYSRGLLSDSGLGCDELNVSLFRIGAAYVTIENLYLGIDDSGSSGGVIDFSASSASFTLRHCLIETQYAATYGVYSSVYDLAYLLIEDCAFGARDRSNFTNALNFFNCSMHSIIRRNTFTGCTAACISLRGSVGGLGIYDNKFQLVSDTEGYAITIATGASNNHISGNEAAFGTAAPATNPYYDGCTADSNDWGLNYAGGVAVSPATG